MENNILLTFPPDDYIKLSRDLFFDTRCRIRIYEFIRFVEEIEAKRKEDGRK